MKKIYKLKALILLTIFLCFSFVQYSSAQNVWFNEIHYDNPGGDVGEFIEVVIEDAGSYTLSDFTVTLYNGNGGGSYNTKTLDVFTVGVTTNNFTIYYYDYPTNGIQNGSPDGMALDYQGTVISGQFLSYEGTFVATNGPANGMTSVDIGVSEPADIGESLQLSGTGTLYSDFTWQDPAPETPGNLNNGQTIGGTPDPEPTNYPTNFIADASGLSITLTWDDAVGGQLPAAYLIKVSDQDDIVAPVDGTPEPDDTDLSDGTGALNISQGVETCTFYRLFSQTEYFFKIFPYTNGGTNIDYKTDGTPPSASDSTDAAINTEDFETGTFGTWSSYSVASDKDWTVLDYGGALGTTWFAQMNGYNENEPSNDWLISPSLNFNNYSSEKMVFYTQWKYGNTDSELILKYSTDYTGGNPTAASWTGLTFNKPIDQEVWESSGDVDLSFITGGNVHVAFQYLSSGTPRRWNVDEIEITGNPIIPIINVTSPVAGDLWEQGTAHNIQWTVSNTGQYVMIEVTPDASSGNPTWSVLTPSVPASQGLWTWYIPADQTVSNDYKIRITDFTYKTVGESGIFSVIEPIVIYDLVITEIMYNPPESGTDSLEFIEIYNNDAVTVDMENYYFADGVEFIFPAVSLNPGDYVLVAVDSLSMLNTFGVNAYQWTSGGLNNSGELIMLNNNYDFFIDSVYYLDYAPWPTEPDGNGPSLTFCDPDLDNSLAENWQASIEFAAINASGDSIFATPGAGCSILPEADFQADTTIVLVDDSVIFTDLSTGNPDSWSWTFYGGTPGSYNQQTPPPIVYDTPGTFDVLLVVSNVAGEDSLIRLDYISVGYVPQADFEASATSIFVGESIDFTDLSTGDPDTWEWIFEGGTPNTSFVQNPDGILYNEVGVYDVTLTVTNLFGTSSLIKTDYIEVGPIGIHETGNKNNIRIYPNPAKNNLFVEQKNGKYSEIKIYSVLGKLVYQDNLNEVITEINLKNLNKGIYFVKVYEKDTQNIVLKKLIIQ
ncbi:MAG: lamin tail domain-containing protein [Bacteroidales bacterium]|nr:lamin tail domain-containing protein [Bacteroidales bacterium]